MPYLRPLNAWLTKPRYWLKSPAFLVHEGYKVEAAWVCLDHVVSLHEAAELELVPFHISWTKTLEYLAAACKILGRGNPGPGLSPMEEAAVRAALGDPPAHSYSIYCFTVEEAGTERP